MSKPAIGRHAGLDFPRLAATLKQAIFGPRTVTRVAGLFDTRMGAERTARDLPGASGLRPDQVTVLSPLDAQADRRAAQDPSAGDSADGRGQPAIPVSVIRPHVAAGALGLLLGVLLYAVLMAAASPAMHVAPVLMLAVLAALGSLFGLMLGGLLALRPDESRVVARVRRGLDRGRWAVLAMPVDAGQTRRVVAAFARQGVRVVRSF
jgi:hypothetical protein